MEDTLGVKDGKVDPASMRVLILVLMEDTLGEVGRQWNNLYISS